MMKKIFKSAFTYTFGALFVASGVFCQDLQSLESEEILSSSQQNKTISNSTPVPNADLWENIEVYPNVTDNNNGAFLSWGNNIGRSPDDPILVKVNQQGTFAINGNTTGLDRISYLLISYTGYKNSNGDWEIDNEESGALRADDNSLLINDNIITVTFGDNKYMDLTKPELYHSKKRTQLLKIYLYPTGSLEPFVIERHILKVDPSVPSKIKDFRIIDTNLILSSPTTAGFTKIEMCPMTDFILARGTLEGEADEVSIRAGSYNAPGTNAPIKENYNIPPPWNEQSSAYGEWLKVVLNKENRTFEILGTTPNMATKEMLQKMSESKFRIVARFSPKIGDKNSNVNAVAAVPDIYPKYISNDGSNNGQYAMDVKQTLPNITSISISNGNTGLGENGDIVRNHKKESIKYKFFYSQDLYSYAEVELIYTVRDSANNVIYGPTTADFSTAAKTLESSINWNSPHLLDVGTYRIEAKLQRKIDDKLRSCLDSKTEPTIKYVEIVNPLSATFEYVQPLCYGDGSKGQIIVTYKGGRPPYMFANRSIGSPFSENPDDVFKDLMSSGIPYQPVVKDGFNDSEYKGEAITFKEPAELYVSAKAENPSCYLSGDGRIALTIEGGTQPIRISWSNGASDTDVISGLSGGKYTANVTDKNGCTAPTTFIERTLSEPPKIDVNINHQMSLEDDFWMTADVILSASGGRGGPFKFSENGSDYSFKNVYSKNNGKHLFYIQDTQSGCVAKEEYTLNLDPDDKIEVPQFVSPNGDGYNDSWTIWRINMPEKYNENEVFLFNSSGKQIAYFKNYDNKTVFWDGTDKNGKTVPNGVYYYVIYTYPNKKRKFTGWIMVGGVNSELDK